MRSAKFLILSGMIAGLSVWLMTVSTDAQTPGAGKADGWLKVNGMETRLAYAYAVAEVPELAMPDQGKDGFDLLVTDKPLSEAEITCRTLLQFRVSTGALHGIALSFNPAKKGIHHGSLLYEKKTLFFSTTGDSDAYRFSGTTLSREAISGKVWMPKAQETDLPGSEPVTFQYEAIVQATVRRPGPVTATLTGKAAQESPQAKVLRAYCKAGRAGSVAGLQAASVKAQAVLLSGPEGKQLLQAIQQSLPDPARLTVTKVILRGNLAVVQGKAPEPIGAITMKCLKDGAEWKVGLN